MSGDAVLALLRGADGLPELHDAPAWEALARRLGDESLTGVALTRLRAAGRLDAVPASARALLEADLKMVRAGQTVLWDRFASFAACLHAAGVPFIVHKGAALAELVYDRPEDRPMADIDVVFRPPQWRTVREALKAHRYRMPVGAGEAFWLENYFNISATSPEPSVAHFDLHWGLTQEGRYHVDTEDLFDRAVPYRSALAGGAEVLRLGTEDLLLSLFLHLAYHYFEARLLWLHDMKLVIERCRPDWARLRERASAWGLNTVLAFNLDYLGKVFPGTVPADVAASCRASALRRGLVRPLRSTHPRHLFRFEKRRLGQFALGMASIDRPADMARFAAGKVIRSMKWAGRNPRRH
jgi:hypothetical protein